MLTCHAHDCVESHMGWLQLVGSLKLQVSFAKEPYQRDYILQKRPIFLRSLLIVATPYIQMIRVSSSVFRLRMNESMHLQGATQCVAVCCSVLQCSAVCVSVLQCVVVCYSVLQCAVVCCSVLQCVAVCCSVLQCSAVCCSVLQCAVVCCSVLQCAVVCCSMLYCAVVCCSVLQ